MHIRVLWPQTTSRAARLERNFAGADRHEFFFTLEGKLIIELEDMDPVELNPQQGYVVPKGKVHKTLAPEKTVVLMIELAGIVPTGDS